MNLIGMGLLCSRGRGTEAFRQALLDGVQEPGTVSVRGRNLPCHAVDLERIQDRSVLKKLRRADKLSKMAVLAAMDAVAESGIGEQERARLGVIVSTGFGAHVTTFEFLDGILDFGEAAVSPTVFSNSVHNAAASYISSSLGIQGPTLTVTRFFFPIQAALQLAQAWMREGRMEHVLVGAVDQLGEVMAYITDARLGIPADGKLRPFDPAGRGAVPGEGAAFFLLSAARSDRAYCRVSDVLFGTDQEPSPKADLDIIDLDGLSGGPDRHAPAPDTPLASYSPLFGSMMIGSAFSLAAGALMVRDQVLYRCPDPVSPGGLPVLAQHTDSAVDFIRCIRYNCRSIKCSIHLKKQ